MQYRREIDGLRAVAVVPVILFHAGFEAFSGGFVGVDVFFVISGYLITTIIHGEVREGTFSLVRFYERRIRRILPALILVCLACIPFAWLWMMPNEFRRFAQSLVAVNVFASNILFLRESGYFAAAAELKPLLHTWSLAVEEQFYVVFPLLLLLLGKLGRKSLLLLLAALVVMSLGLAEWGARAYPLASFYLLPTRAWELGVGAVLAVGGAGLVSAVGWRAQAAAAIGLGLVGSAFFLFDRSFSVPGLWALIPVSGTALIIIYARHDTLVGKLLGWKPVVGIGLISYSAYLWHQPLFAFARIRLWDEVSDATYLGLSGLALVLAYLSWRFVEQPFRNKSVFSRKMIFSGAAGLSATLIAFGVFGHKSHGIPDRHADRALAVNLEKRLQGNRGLKADCNGALEVTADCKTGEIPQIIVWGDSHAMHLVDGILASKPDAAIVQRTKSHCGPFFDLAPISFPQYNEAKALACLEFNRAVQNYIAENKSLKYAVLASPFSQYLNDEARVYYQGAVLNPETGFVIERFEATLDWLVQNGVTPIVFASPPRNGRNSGLCLARNTWFGTERTQCRITIADNVSSAPNVAAFLGEIAKKYQVVAMQDFLCGDRDCMVEEDGVLIYRDGAHLSHEGARHLGKMMNFYGLITGRE